MAWATISKSGAKWTVIPNLMREGLIPAPPGA